MEFGYFTLSDNHYDNNPRSPNQFVADIADEALYADTLGMHSAWIGEHHFNSLGVLSCPDLVLAYIAARTKQIRLAPAAASVVQCRCHTLAPLRLDGTRLSRTSDGQPM
jgi:alkanesulfonate monooxygenase SsuD/methylene tetrahydromethanopterin reductase-like flavin-dependent oxidoreductase (luciferase family)